jgi:hypothetical protein
VATLALLRQPFGILGAEANFNFEEGVMTRTSYPHALSRYTFFVFGLGITLLSLATPAPAQPGLSGPLVFDTELTSLNLTGGPVALPLASDPGNALGDSIDGYGFVNSQVMLTLSSQRAMNPGPASLGEACAFPGEPTAAGGSGQCGQGELDAINPAEHDGEPFFVSSFFDVFFDITVTDVDPRPGRDYVGALPAINIQDIGPANMQNFFTAIFDADAPNFGLIPPPESSPYIGHFNIEIDLSAYFGMLVDINANGIGDKIKFTLAAHTVDGENRTFIVLPDGTVIDSFDSTASLAGAIVDVTSDPPFGPFELAGPTTAQSLLLNPVVPEPGTLMLLAATGLMAPTFRRRHGARR